MGIKRNTLNTKRTPRTRGMRIKPQFIVAGGQVGDETLVFEETTFDGLVAKRVTVELGLYGAEEIAERLGELLRRRREHAARFDLTMKAATE